MTSTPSPTQGSGRWLLAVIAAGLGLRTFHYLRNPSVWHDEAALVVNVLDKNFAELLGPLRWSEAGPPLFLWVERAVALALGDSTFALRLPPFLASCAALLLFAWVARRLLPATAAVWAVLLFAGSDRLLWHCCEAKPYALDVFLATGVLALHVGTRGWSVARRCLLHAVLAPGLIFLSYPGAFLCGASLVALLPAAWRDRRPGVVLAYAAWACAVAAAFLLLVLGPVRAQRCGAMESCWTHHFPDWSQPASVPQWALLGTVEVVGYCFRPVGQVYVVLAIVGAVGWWRCRQRCWVVLTALPLGLALVAALLNKYPYGGSRLEAFAAPGMALLVGAGLMFVANWLRARHSWAPSLVFVLLAAVPLVSVYRVAVPWVRADGAGATAYVRSHWRPGEAVVGNDWEHDYYFRHVDAPFTLLEGDARLPQQRCWVVLTAATDEGRRALAGNLFGARSILDQREFVWTTVTLLEAAREAPTPSDGPTLPNPPVAAR